MTIKKGRKPLSVEKTNERRENILSAANKLFAQKGYENISMRRLADEINMSPMSIYTYFENKRAILIHLWGNIFEDLFNDCRIATTLVDDHIKKLEKYANCFVRYWIENPQNYLMVYGQIDKPTSSESFFAESPLVTKELEFIALMLIETGVKPQSVELVTQQFLCVLHGVCHSVITIPEINWRDHTQLVGGLVRALVPTKTATS